MKLNPAETYLKKIFELEGDLPEMSKAVNAVWKYKRMRYDYDSKNVRLQTWQIDKDGIKDLILCIFTAVLSEPCMTYQAMCGKLNHKIELSDKIDRVKTLAEVIAVVSKTGLWGIAQTGRSQYYYISTDYELECLLPTTDKHKLYRYRPQPVESNRDEEYGRILLGDPHHFHNGELCLSHLNKLNQTQFVLNQEFIAQNEEKPKHVLDTPLKQEQWDHFVKESRRRYEALGDKKFHLLHKYDSRGRTYSCGYYVNPQGAAYKKASIELAHKEVLK